MKKLLEVGLVLLLCVLVSSMALARGNDGRQERQQVGRVESRHTSGERLQGVRSDNHTRSSYREQGNRLRESRPSPTRQNADYRERRGPELYQRNNSHNFGTDLRNHVNSPHGRQQSYGNGRRQRDSRGRNVNNPIYGRYGHTGSGYYLSERRRQRIPDRFYRERDYRWQRSWGRYHEFFCSPSGWWYDYPVVAIVVATSDWCTFDYSDEAEDAFLAAFCQPGEIYDNYFEEYPSVRPDWIPPATRYNGCEYRLDYNSRYRDYGFYCQSSWVDYQLRHDSVTLSYLMRLNHYRYRHHRR